MKECKLVSGLFSILIQCSLGILSILAVFVKRQFEYPRRTLLVWSFDVSKQCLGAALIHVVNIAFSIVLASNFNARDECMWYFMSFLIDSTIGIAIILVLLNLVERFIVRFLTSNYFLLRGQYCEPPSVIAFTAQLVIWLLVTAFGKVMTCFIQYRLAEPMSWYLETAFYYVHQYPDIELSLVMILIPLVVNVVQFCITDHFLKKNSSIASISRANFAHLPASEKTVDESGHEVQPLHAFGLNVSLMDVGGRETASSNNLNSNINSNDINASATSLLSASKECWHSLTSTAASGINPTRSFSGSHSVTTAHHVVSGSTARSRAVRAPWLISLKSSSNCQEWSGHENNEFVDNLLAQEDNVSL